MAISLFVILTFVAALNVFPTPTTGLNCYQEYPDNFPTLPLNNKTGIAKHEEDCTGFPNCIKLECDGMVARDCGKCGSSCGMCYWCSSDMCNGASRMDYNIIIDLGLIGLLYIAAG